jgi:hypothetical protein
LPTALENAISAFTYFYNANLPKRILQWSFVYSICEVEGKIGNKTYLFIVNTFQAMILLFFNHHKYNDLSCQDFISLLGCGLTYEGIKSYLNPLIANKLILKNTTSNSIANSNFEQQIETFRLNSKFISNNRKIKMINTAKNKDLIKKEKIEDDRSASIEANIVRIMKSQKRILHNDLINKVLQQLETFKVKINVSYIFKAIFK